MAEEYHSHAPVRFGKTIANFAVVPSSPGLLALKSHPFSPKTPNALREAINAFFQFNPAEFDFKIQLVENATAKQHYTVARLVIAAQNSADLAMESPAFSPLHASVPQESANRLATSVMSNSVLSRMRRRKSRGLAQLNVLPV